MNSKETFSKIQTILFDMDGVVTREDDYHLAAELTVLELLYSDQFVGLKNDVITTILYKPGMAVAVNKFVSPKIIQTLKNSGINTNWDLAFFCTSIYLVELLVDLHGKPILDRIRAEGFTEATLRGMGESHPNLRRDIEFIEHASAFFFQFRKKREEARLAKNEGNLMDAPRSFFEDLNAWLTERTGIAEKLLERGNPFWDLCRTLFQERYLGDDLFEREEGKHVSKMRKDGLVNYETPIIPVSQIIDTLAMLKEAGLTFGIATGRPFMEIIIPLERWGLLHLFDQTRIATYREELRAEKMLAKKGEPQILAKPNPFLYVRALYPELSDQEVIDFKLPIPNTDEVLIVGDSAADFIAAKAMGCRSGVVLTGVKDLSAAEYIKMLNPDFILKDVAAIKNLF